MPETLAQKVRAKYPGAYDDLDDAALEAKVLAKHPQYGDLPRSKATPAPGVHYDEQGRATADEKPSASLGTLAVEAGKGVLDTTITPIWQTLKAFATAGTDPQHADPVGDLVKNLAGAHKDQYDKGKQAFHDGRYSEAVSHFTAAGLPLIGPAAAHAGELIGTGEPEQMARGAGQAAGLLAPYAREPVAKAGQAARGPVGRAVTGAGNVLEAVGTSKPAEHMAGYGAAAAALHGNVPTAIAAVATPPAFRIVGRGVQRVGQAMEGSPAPVAVPPRPATGGVVPLPGESGVALTKRMAAEWRTAHGVPAEGYPAPTPAQSGPAAASVPRETVPAGKGLSPTFISSELAIHARRAKVVLSAEAKAAGAEMMRAGTSAADAVAALADQAEPLLSPARATSAVLTASAKGKLKLSAHEVTAARDLVTGGMPVREAVDTVVRLRELPAAFTGLPTNEEMARELDARKASGRWGTERQPAKRPPVIPGVTPSRGGLE